MNRMRTVSACLLLTTTGVGCVSHTLSTEQNQVRQQLLKLHDDQIMDNLMRAYNFEPILQLEYKDMTGTVTDKGMFDVGASQTDTAGLIRNFFEYGIEGSRTNQLTITGTPVNDTSSVSEVGTYKTTTNMNIEGNIPGQSVEVAGKLYSYSPGIYQEYVQFVWCMKPSPVEEKLKELDRLMKVPAAIRTPTVQTVQTCAAEICDLTSIRKILNDQLRDEARAEMPVEESVDEKPGKPFSYKGTSFRRGSLKDTDFVTELDLAETENIRRIAETLSNLKPDQLEKVRQEESDEIRLAQEGVNREIRLLKSKPLPREFCYECNCEDARKPDCGICEESKGDDCKSKPVTKCSKIECDSPEYCHTPKSTCRLEDLGAKKPSKDSADDYHKIREFNGRWYGIPKRYAVDYLQLATRVMTNVNIMDGSDSDSVAADIRQFRVNNQAR